MKEFGRLKNSNYSYEVPVLEGIVKKYLFDFDPKFWFLNNYDFELSFLNELQIFQSFYFDINALIHIEKKIDIELGAILNKIDKNLTILNDSYAMETIFFKGKTYHSSLINEQFQDAWYLYKLFSNIENEIKASGGLFIIIAEKI